MKLPPVRLKLSSHRISVEAVFMIAAFLSSVIRVKLSMYFNPCIPDSSELFPDFTTLFFMCSFSAECHFLNDVCIHEFCYFYLQEQVAQKLFVINSVNMFK